MHFYIDSVEESCQNKAGMKAMIEYLIDFELKQFQIVFTIRIKDDDLSVYCKLNQYQLSSSLLSLQKLSNLLQSSTSILNFSIQDLELSITFPIGKVKRNIYLPIQQEDPQIIRIFMSKSRERLETIAKQTQEFGNNEVTQINHQITIFNKQKQAWHDLLVDKHRLVKTYEEELKALAQQDLKLNRQILTIDQQILSSKRGLQLEQYRSQTSSQKRLQRKKKVYISQISRLTNPKIQKLIRDSSQPLLRIELGQCELKFMKFIQIFEYVQQLRLPSNNIKKIQGLSTLLQLRKIDLQSNMIQKIEGFNNNLEIRQIRLHSNRINRLQNIFHLCRLEVLVISQNLMEDIPKDIKMLECLVEMRLMNNKLNHLPWELLTLNKLRILSLNGNPCLKENHRSKELLKKLATAKIEIINALV